VPADPMTLDLDKLEEIVKEAARPWSDGSGDRFAIAAAMEEVVEACPALIARVRELEAGLREAMKRWSTFAVHPDERAERDRLRALLTKES
jgi:aspartate aminotransferase-like enzyme